jgi:lysophospholipase L1-like esterase
MKLSAIFTFLPFLSLPIANTLIASQASQPWSIYHQAAAAEVVVAPIGPGANDVTMRTLEFRDVPPGSQMDAFQAMRDFHANRLEWTYIDFDERNREAIERVIAMGRLFGGAGSASLHGSIRNFPPQTKEMHMLDLEGNMVIQPHMRAWTERRGIGDPSNPEYYAHHLSYWQKIIDWGAQSLHRDEPESPVFAAERFGGGFTPTGIAGFRDWLNEKFTSVELAALGVDSPDDFDYADYLRDKGAPVGDAFRGFDDPLKAHWVAYWQDVTTDFWRRMISDIKDYTGNPDFTVSCNNSSLQMWAPYHREFDFAISELLLETAHPVHLWQRARIGREFGKLQVFGPPKTRAQPVPLEVKDRLLRRVFATAYATGMIGKIPWDVFDQSPDGHARYFAEAETIADLSGFVRDQDWSGYREAVAFGSGIDAEAMLLPQVLGGSGGVYGFLRAPVSGDGELMLHLIDWGVPENEPGAGNWFVTPGGERIRMRDPLENMVRTESKPFQLMLSEEAFARHQELQFELVTPAPYDAVAHVLAEETGNYSALVRRQRVPVTYEDGKLVLQLPALDPWGILRIRPAGQFGYGAQKPAVDSLGLLTEERWAVLGDSISQSGRYHRYLENFLVTRFPLSELQIFNEGIGGDTAAGGLRRLDWDLFASSPTVVSIKYGMNDVRRNLYFTTNPSPANVESRQEQLKAYQENLTRLVDEIHDRGARVILVAPSPADDSMLSNPMVDYEVNQGLAQCVEILKELAQRRELPLVNIFGPMQALNLALQIENPGSTLVGRDRVHPGVEGHFLMSYLWLQKLFGEIAVSSVVIDAQEGRVVEQFGAQVEAIITEGGGIAFDWQAESLPFAIPEGAEKVAQRLGFDELFNRELLVVQGLSPGVYELSIDGESVLTAIAEEWSTGVNLARIGSVTPQLMQAREVAAVLEKKQNIQQTLSDIAFCELRLWGERSRPVDLSEMRNLLLEAEKIELQKQTPHPAILRRYREYEGLKSREQELWQEAILLAKEARQMALPINRRFTMKQLAETHTIMDDIQLSQDLPLWLCAGQSNMAFRVAAAADRDRIIELLEGATVYALDAEGVKLITAGNADGFSAVGVSFAASLSHKWHRPFGITTAAVGGTAIEAWLPLEAFPATDEASRMKELAHNPEVLAAAELDADDFLPWGQHRLARWGLGRAVPGALFEQYIRPLKSLPIAGVVWYQGESNAHSPEQASAYEAWLLALIHGYRKFFSNPELQFVIVQLPHFEPADLEMTKGWEIIRATQQRVAENTAGVFWVDITDQGEANDIHPARKSVVGQRAAAVVFGS